MASERFGREPAAPRLAEAPPAGADLATDDRDRAALLDRLERQAAESGRLDGRVQTLERALRSERDARRRAVETLKRERKAAGALAERAKREAAGHASAAAEVERLRQVVATSEQQLQVMSLRLTEAEQELDLRQRPLLRRLFGRPPTG